MKPTGSRRHLNTRTALDYLECRMDPAGRRAVEAHLGRSCLACRLLVRELGWLLERMLLDRTPEVSDTLRTRALEAFDLHVPFAPVAPARAGIAVLLFDSWRTVLPAAAHRAVGELRRLRFALGAEVLELESEIESSDARTLRGRLHAPDPLLHRIELAVRGERLSTRPDTDGAFVFDRVPLGKARLSVIGARQRFRIPMIE